MLARLQDWLLQQGLAREAKLAGLREEALALPFGRLSILRPMRGGPLAPEATLMLHGAAADKSSWIRLARFLDSGAPLLIPDLPGHGGSVADPSLSYGIGEQAERMRALLQSLGVARVHLVASSMGGAIALHLAAAHPTLVASLVLIGAVGVQAHESWLQQHIRETGRNPMICIGSKDDYLAMLEVGMKRPPYLPGFVLSSLARAYTAREAINARIARDIESGLDQRAKLPAVRAPALIIWGRDDQVSHPANAQLLHSRLAGSTLAMLDGVGHVPMVESPQQVAALCNAFFARQRAAQAA